MIRVIDYDLSWRGRFAALKQEYSLALARSDVDVVAIEHVGSTSVPGLAAKPIIDCDIVVTADQVAPASDVLVGLGFQALGELGIPQRWAFKEPPRLAGTPRVPEWPFDDTVRGLRRRLRLYITAFDPAQATARLSRLRWSWLLDLSSSHCGRPCRLLALRSSTRLWLALMGCGCRLQGRTPTGE